MADSDPGGVSASADNKALRERAARLGYRLRKRRGSYWLLDNDDDSGMGFETLADAADEIGRRERGQQRSANHTIPKARRGTPQAAHGAVLPEDWHEISLGALWDHFNRPRKTPQTTIEAVIHSVRERGVAALIEPANIERLLECDDASRIEINERIALIAVESLTSWLTLLSEEQRVWLRDIAARLRRAT